MSEVAAISGSERAAILLLSLGEDQAAAVLQHMGAKEVQRLGAAMATMESVPKERAETVLNDFVSELDDQTSLGVGSDDYIRKVMVTALGEDKASRIIDRILIGRNSKGLESLKWMDARAVCDLIRGEHPQIIAIVLSYLDADHAAAILPLLPERDRIDVLMRIASLDGIQARALMELDEIIEHQFSGSSDSKASSVGGVKSAANILNCLETSQEQLLIEKISEADERLGQKIEDLMFVFDNLAEVDDRSMQMLLREVKNDQLSVALRGAAAPVRDKILSNMSQRAAEMLREDIDSRGPVRVADVDIAQKEILGVARRLADEGQIQLGATTDDFV